MKLKAIRMLRRLKLNMKFTEQQIAIVVTMFNTGKHKLWRRN